MKILIALDGSEESRVVVDELSRRPWSSGADVKMVHTVESPFPLLPDHMGVGAEAARQEHTRAAAEGERLLEEMSGILNSRLADAVNIETEVITAPYGQTPQQVIVEEAARWNADLIMLGSRGKSAWKRLLVGSVSMGVVQHAPCSVEIVRSKGANI